MSSGRKVAVVTGSNKGIGYEIVRGLCKQFDGDVILTARNPELGAQAVKSLEADGLKPKFHQLDISNKDSVLKLKDFIEKQYGGLDVLVNNAAIAFKIRSSALRNLRISFRDGFNKIKPFEAYSRCFRVAHVGSFVSAWTFKKCSESLQKQFLRKDLTMDEVKDLMTQFVQATKDGKHKEKGWPESAYGMSKVGVYLMTIVQQMEFDQTRPGDDIVVNCCCPGWVQTDMSSKSGPKTPDQGADTPIYASLLPPNGSAPKGQFLSKRTVMEWPGRIGDEEYLK